VNEHFPSCLQSVFDVNHVLICPVNLNPPMTRYFLNDVFNHACCSIHCCPPILCWAVNLLALRMVLYHTVSFITLDPLPRRYQRLPHSSVRNDQQTDFSKVWWGAGWASRVLWVEEACGL